MSVVGGAVIRRIAEVASAPIGPNELLSGVGLPPRPGSLDAMHELVAEEAYYELLERATADGDSALPVRYGEIISVDDFGALGLALKTASTLREALTRLARYILVLSDSLEYQLVDVVGGADFVLHRPGHRRGARLANECAIAAIVSLLRQIAPRGVLPTSVSFSHPPPDSIEAHEAFFGCPVRFEAGVNAILVSDAILNTRTRLADEGLSAFILATLDSMKTARTQRALPTQLRSAITDALPDGRPTRGQIARQLGMSERTLHRRLADHGETFQSIVARAQREAAESLLADRSSSLAEVAFLTGFSDQSAFTRAFKRWTGRTPLNFRSSQLA